MSVVGRARPARRRRAGPRRIEPGPTNRRRMSASDQTSHVPAPGRWLANQPYLLLSITALCWAGNAIVGRLAAGHIPPVTLSFLRWSMAFLIILPFAWKHLKHDWAAIRARLGIMIAALPHRHRHLQHPAILGAGIYPGAQHAAAAVGRAADRRAVVADPARRAADAGAGVGRRAVADRRAGDPPARRHHRARPASSSTRATSSSRGRW